MTHLRLLFASVVFLASFLLFLVEPIAARQLLPILGGSAAVWITCLVFFQIALLLLSIHPALREFPRELCCLTGIFYLWRKVRPRFDR